MRMSSEMFPFASHAEYGYDLEFADKELKEAGALARKYGHRLTTHPGQVSLRVDELISSLNLARQSLVLSRPV